MNNIKKNIIMCVTTGRSGTNLLENLLSLALDTCALHEPKPAFQDIISDLHQNPVAAEIFVQNEKLPDILSRPYSNYVETSHMFCKGFFEAFIKLDIPFKVIFLHRNPRDVAKSYWRIKAIPGRTKRGNIYFIRNRKMFCRQKTGKASAIISFAIGTALK